jgi:hypothetical protein
MRERGRKRLLICLAETAIVVFVIAILPTLQSVSAETAYIYGLSGWFSSGDTIQFIGDVNVLSVPPNQPDCAQWSDDCVLDNGFGFREVSGVNTTTCSISDSSTTCYAFGVVCCYWLGDCSEHPCDKPHLECWESEDECGENCYCMSIWEVQAFNASQGDATDGCYEIELICEGGGADCLHGAGCSSIVTWY